MEQSLQLINDFLDRVFIYGPFWIYLVLFMASFVENLFPPFPGDFFTLTGGALAGTGRLNIYLVFISVYLGGIASVMIIYYLGYNQGRAYFLRKNYRIFSREDILKLEGWFKRKGVVLLIFNRFIVGLRLAIILVAGISRHNPVKTFMGISISYWLFNGILLFGGYIFMQHFDRVIYYFNMYEKIVWPVIIVLAIVLIIWKVYKTKKNGKKA